MRHLPTKPPSIAGTPIRGITTNISTSYSSLDSITPLPPPSSHSNKSRPGDLNDLDETKHNGLEGPPHILRRPSRAESHPHVEEEVGCLSRVHSSLPYAISHFLGHRRTPPARVHPILDLFWAFVGIVCSISLIAVLTQHIPMFFENGAPVIVASFGAAAVLEFQAIQSPFAQPRNIICSQIIASILGVSMSKLFGMLPNHHSIRFIGGALSCAVATVLMGITGTVHPPAGATALIAVVDENCIKLGWHFVPLVLLSCILMFTVALLINNIQKQYPVYWWSPKKETDTILPKNRDSNFFNASAIEFGEVSQVPKASHR